VLIKVAAGNSLFNVVVDNDETAAKLMKKLEEKNMGRVCFMPLNRLRVRDVAYPDSSDVVPLLEAAMTYPREVSSVAQSLDRGPVCILYSRRVSRGTPGRPGHAPDLRSQASGS
jgi:structural maintenance of chromosome 3 (chondroitin sulfate proteoglycan 6)